MKKIVLGVLFLFWITLISAQTTYTVKFVNKYKGEDFRPDKMYLFSIEKKMAIDSVVGKEGVFTFTGQADRPQLASICGTADGFYVIAAFILDEIPIEVTFETAPKIQGSVENDRMVQITNAIAEGGQQQRAIQMEAERLAEKYQGEFPDTVARRLDLEWEKVSRQQMTALENGVLENKDNLVSLYFLMNYGDVMDIDFLNAYFEDYKYKDSKLLEKVFQRLDGENRKRVGALFTDFTMTDLNGNDRKLSDYAGKGQYVLLDFWASWCAPCRMEMPKIKELYDRYHSKGFQIVGISLDNQEKAWKSAVAEMKMNWVQLSDLKGWKNVAAGLYYVREIPATLLLDPSGKIVAVGWRGEELEQKLVEIYGGE